MTSFRAPGLRLGAYLAETPPTEWRLPAFEQLTRARCSIVSFYYSWGLGVVGDPFRWMREVAAQGRIPMLTWEPWRLPPGDADPARWPGHSPFALKRIAAGAFDEYIRHWARELGAIPGPVYLRLMHEMNGDWYPWGGSVNRNTPELFREVWWRARGIFASIGVTNVEWVWSPYAHSVPNRPDNEMEHYYPGDHSVDRVALDAYNWGDMRPWARWQPLRELIGDAYERLARLSSRPMMLAEVGCAESGGDKGAWLEEAFTDVQGRFSRISEVVWFSIDKECDWRIESSPRSLACFSATWGGAC